MEDTRHVKGLKELSMVLSSFSPKLQKNIMRGALRAGSTVILNAAKAKIHNVSGETAKSLRVNVKTKGEGFIARILAGNSKILNRPIWLEYGTRPHFLSMPESEKPVNRKASARAGRLIRASMTTINRNALRIGNRLVGGAVKHSGSNPHPFMRPALDSSATRAVVAMAEYIKQRITKEGINVSSVVVKGDD